MTRILVAHSSYVSGPVSGENQVVDAEVRLLQRHGHEVRLWTPMVDTRGAIGLLRAGAGSIWSSRAATELRRFIRSDGIQVAHFHNLFPALSPAVVGLAADEGVAVVMTLHNYRLLCLPATFMRDGRICEACLGHLPWRGLAHGCYRKSRPASGALAASLALHRALRTFDGVTLFLAISRFVRDKHVEGGLPPARIWVKPHFAWPSRRRHGPGEYFLYLGRLSVEKGVGTLLTAWRSVSSRLLVVGDGPDANRVRAEAPPNVTLLPPVPAREVPNLVARARAVVVPSVWYEGAGRVVQEAYAAGVPVLGSRIGALPEVIEDGLSGRLLTPGAADDWAAAAAELADDAESERLGAGAFRLWEERYGPTQAIRHLERAYAAALRGSCAPS